MFFKATISQTSFNLKQKGAIFAFFVLLAMVLMNFIANVLTFQGHDVLTMYHPMKILLLSYNRTYYNADATLLLIQLYPLLVVCPAGFTLAKEQHSGQDVLMIARLGSHTYKFSKFLAAFLSTTIVFTVPFLIEIILNCLSFPLSATGDLTNGDIYNPSYIKMIYNYPLSGLYLRAPYLYTIIRTLFWGFVSGVFGAFTVAFSSLVRMKYRVFLFLPVFLLLNATAYITILLPDAPAMNWYDYLLIFNDSKRSFIFYIGILILILISLISLFLSSRNQYFTRAVIRRGNNVE